MIGPASLPRGWRLSASSLWLSLALLALFAGAWRLPALARHPRRLPLRFACWYWHRPFRLTGSEQQQLRQARILRLYVYAGTLEARDSTLRLVRTQQWQSPAPCELYAVIRIYPGANGAFLAPAGAAQAAALIRGVPSLRTLPGIQWDADVPTARLGEYARFLRRFRRLIAPGRKLSVTALPDWLRSREYRAVCDAVDEVAPQFYGNQWPEPGRRPPALWETQNLLKAVRRSAGGRARVWVGLPAYGRCVVMDAHGRPVGVRHDLDPDLLLDDPAWEVEARDTRRERWDSAGPLVPVEDTLALRCRENTGAGMVDMPAGAWLWFQWPRVGGLRDAIAAIRRQSLPGVEGVCLFRWPAPDEPLTLSSASLVAAVRSGPPAAESVPELHLHRKGPTVSVTVANPGSDSPMLDGGIRLEVQPPRGAAVLADEPVTWQHGEEPASALRGDRAIFSRPLLRPGHRWEVCRVADCSGPVQVTAHWKGADGRWRSRTVHEVGREVTAQAENSSRGSP